MSDLVNKIVEVERSVPTASQSTSSNSSSASDPVPALSHELQSLALTSQSADTHLSPSLAPNQSSMYAPSSNLSIARFPAPSPTNQATTSTIPNVATNPAHTSSIVAFAGAQHVDASHAAFIAIGGDVINHNYHGRTYSVFVDLKLTHLARFSFKQQATFPNEIVECDLTLVKISI